MASIATFMVCGLPTVSHAQDDVRDKNISSLEYENVDVREALKALFKVVGVSFSVAPEVQGTVTVSLHNVTFETALQNITRQVEATYRIEGGVYQVVKREDNGVAITETYGTTPAPTTTKVVRRIKIRSADPMFIAMMLSGAGQDYTAPPERSTLLKGGSNNGFGSGGFGSGMNGNGFGSGNAGSGGFSGGFSGGSSNTGGSRGF